MKEIISSTGKILKYEEAIKKTASYQDALGLGMDKGIIETVTLLQLLGYITCGSCEGHVGVKSGELSPWIDITIRVPKNLIKLKNIKFESYKKQGDGVLESNIKSSQYIIKSKKLNDERNKLFVKGQVLGKKLDKLKKDFNLQNDTVDAFLLRKISLLGIYGEQSYRLQFFDFIFDGMENKKDIPLSVRKWIFSQTQKELHAFTNYLYQLYMK